MSGGPHIDPGGRKQREEHAPGVSPVSGTAPPNETRWQPGQSGNPAGRKSAGATIKEWINSLIERDLTEAEIRTIARDKRTPASKRIAAERILRALEAGDLADMDPVVRGEMTLAELRDSGVNTEIVKKLKRKRRTTKDGETEDETEIELHDRAGNDFDRIIDRTEGRPTQSVNLSGEVDVKGVELRVVGMQPKD